MMSQNHGIVIDNSPNTTLEENICRSNSRYGIYLLVSPNSTLRKCITERNDQGGILLEESQNSVIEESKSAKGIKLVDSAYCSIDNNVCTESGYGIYLKNSSFCKVINNNIERTYNFGIKIENSMLCELLNNSCYRFAVGIKIVDSLNISIKDNYLQNCIDGIVIKNSVNSTILNNRFLRAGISFEDSSRNAFETTILSNNFLEVEEDEILLNKEIVLFKNLDNYVFPNTDYGQIILFNCSRLIFEDLHYSNYGIYEIVFYQCKNISFSNNIVKGKIHLSNISESKINSNSINIIRVTDCFNIIIEDNYFVRTELYRSSHLAFKNNTYSSESNYYEVYTWLYISKCKFLKILNNTCHKAFCAIFARYSSFLEIRNNKFSENYGKQGFDLNTYPFKWFLFGSSIEFFNTTNSLVTGNNLTEGSQGVYLIKSPNNLIKNNSARYYGKGIGLYLSDNINITENFLRKNSAGIHIDRSNYNRIMNNTNKVNDGGIVVYDSNYNDIFYNRLNENECGIALIEDCNNNQIICNIIEENEVGIYLHSETKDNILHHNYFMNNTQQAVDDSGKNIWYESSKEEGNYWSDHKGKNPYEIEGDGEAVDPYPLNENLERITRVSSSKIYLIFVSLICVLALRKKYKEYK
ncbi:MAG: right-handed parallel beta-helix repeat-containing protein [Candidatus Heimdallarchaeota archaeon]|nr:right-handed parallel beta-helix repeat-containing protein [Candidatus Heimdallarchaeota archaeon]